MEADRKGFQYPKIDKNICINCGLCEKACSMLGNQANRENGPYLDAEVFAYKAKSARERMKSQSGGGFAGIARLWMAREKDAVIYGVCLDENLKAQYKRIFAIQDLPKLLGSKYVQADMAPIQNDIVSDLKKGRYVLFCGTPCYVSAVKRMVDLNSLQSDRLLLVDFVCHGVMSPELYKEYLEYMGQRIGCKIINFHFRDKKIGGWGSLYSTIYAENGLMYCTKEYLNSYNRDSYDRDSCYSCPYSSKIRNSDLTIADYWSIGAVCRDFYDPLGISCVITGTSKGKEIAEALHKYGYIVKTSLEDALQRPLIEPLAKPAAMKEDWERYENGGIGAILQTEKPIPVWHGIPLTVKWEFLKEFYWAKIRSIRVFRNVKSLFS